MDLEYVVEGPLLWFVFIALVSAVITRLIFFAVAIVRSTRHKQGFWSSNPGIFFRFLLPFHRAALKKPLYSLARYTFHFCLIAVPVWYSGHISLWAESRFEWEWSGLPDAMVDWMTLLVIALALYFVLRRIILPSARASSAASDYAIIVLTALPFVTGYFLTHDTLEGITFLSENMTTFHILSGELMMVMAAILFCRTRLNQENCTGCASCEISCPTETLETSDSGNLRIFTYSHYQCICCGACVNVCPENAAELRHEIGLGKFFQMAAKYKIRSVELESCESCGTLFVPEPQLDKVERSFPFDYLRLCPTCRKLRHRDVIRRISPWTQKLDGKAGEKGQPDAVQHAEP
ncbi:MAG: hypothetical protein JRJ29_09320 [Deltaproteobacteria bacterium]|nr:hypothetical protein [Deltaproteobacteria bacterium]